MTIIGNMSDRHTLPAINGLGTPPTSVISDDPYLELLRKCLTAYLYDESCYQKVNMPSRTKKGITPILKRLILRMLARRQYQLTKILPFDADRRERGMDWPYFGYTMVGLRRLEQLQACIEEVIREAIPGDFIEAGVWRGGCAIFMCAMLARYGVRDRILWAADSFEGLPKPNAGKFPDDVGYDLSDNEYLKVSLDEVKANFARFGLLNERVRFLKGWFSDTLPGAPIDKLAVLRLDGDLYESTMDVLSSLYDRVSPGGFVIIDDYHFWEPCKKAVNDFRNERHIRDELIKIDGSAVYWRAGRG